MEFFYEEIHRAKDDTPYVDTEMTDIDYRAHYHEEVEIAFVLDGTVKITVENTYKTITAGDIAIILPYRIHSFHTLLSSRLYIFKLLCRSFDFSKISLPDYFFSKEGTANSYDAIYQLLMRLVRAAQRPEADRLKFMALRCAADEILLHLAQAPGVSPANQSHIETRHQYVGLLNTVNDYLQKHYYEKIRLEDAADACHFSVYYFARCFKNATGMTFTAYLTEFRLDKAMYQIRNSGETFTNIALRCGFSSVRTFNRCFTNFYKTTPSDIRRIDQTMKSGL